MNAPGTPQYAATILATFQDPEIGLYVAAVQYPNQSTCDVFAIDVDAQEVVEWRAGFASPEQAIAYASKYV